MDLVVIINYMCGDKFISFTFTPWQIVLVDEQNTT